MSEEDRREQPGEDEGQASGQRAEAGRPVEDPAEGTGQEATAGTTEEQPAQPDAEESEPAGESGAEAAEREGDDGQ